MSARTISLDLTVDDKGSVVVKQFGDAAGRELKGVEKKSGDTTNRMASHAEKVKKNWLAMTAAVAAAAAAVYAAGKRVVASVSDFAELEVSLWRIERQAEVMGYAWANTEYISDFARKIGRDSLASAEDVRRATSIMLTQQGLTRDTYERTIRVAQSMSEIYEMQLPQAVRYFSRAMSDTSGAMTMFQRYGMVLTESQQEQIRALQESGRQMEAYKLLLDAIAHRMPDASEGGNTLAHSFDSLGEVQQRVREELGERLAPAVQEVADNMLEWYDANESLIGQKMDIYIDRVSLSVKKLIELSDLVPDWMWQQTPLGAMVTVGEGAVKLLDQVLGIEEGVHRISQASRKALQPDVFDPSRDIQVYEEGWTPTTAPGDADNEALQKRLEYAAETNRLMWEAESAWKDQMWEEHLERQEAEDAYEAEHRAMQFEAKTAELVAWNDMRLEVEQGTSESIMAIREMEAERDRQLTDYRLGLMMNYAQTAMNALAAVSSFSEKESKAMFFAQKAVAMAMAIIQGRRAAIEAAAAVAEIPIVGPALATAAYWTMMAMTAANVAAIAATSIGQSSTGASGAATPSVTPGYGAYQPATEHEPETRAESEHRTVSVEIHVHGNVVDHTEFGRELAPYIQKAIDDGVRR